MLFQKLLGTNAPDVAPTFIAQTFAEVTDNATAITASRPTGTQTGDIMIAVMYTGSTGGATWNQRSGWTKIADLGSSCSIAIQYRIATASEPTSYQFNYNGANNLACRILTYRNAAYDKVGSFVTGANPLVLSSITVAAPQSLLLAVGARSAASVTLGTPTGMTARGTDANTTSPSGIVCEQSVGAGATGTRSMSTGSTTNVAGIMLALKPA